MTGNILRRLEENQKWEAHCQSRELDLRKVAQDVALGSSKPMAHDPSAVRSTYIHFQREGENG